MNLTLYKRRRLRQKPHILTIEQARELGQIAGNKLLRHVSNPGLIPTNLFRLRKRKLELIYKYLFDHRLIHGKEPVIESLQTHQLAEYLLNIIYPGYPACKAKNQAYTEYRQCREKDIGPTPLAYDDVPTTEVYERLDELYRIDVNYEEQNTSPCIEIPVITLKKSMDRIKSANFEKPIEHIEFHLYFWNSTRTLLKPQCKSLLLNSKNIWSKRKQNLVAEGFMHIDITDSLKKYVVRKQVKKEVDNEQAKLKQTTSKSSTNNKPQAIPISPPSNAISPPSNSISISSTTKPQSPPPQKITEKSIKLEFELENNDEYNISHISITAVIRKTTNKLVNDLYLQTTTESITKSLQTSLCPLDTQQIVIHLLKQYNNTEEDKKLKSAENLFLTCKSNSEHCISSSEESDDTIEGFEEETTMISLLDPISFKRIQHPIKSLHCKHRSCFDAANFFDHNADIKLWHCPICYVHIKNIQELRMDYRHKVALAQYPDEDKLFVLQKDTLLSETEMFGEENIATTTTTLSPLVHTEQDSMKRSFLLCEASQQDTVTTPHSQKRYRPLVM